MGGLAPKMPFIAATFVMAGLASLGLPGMNGFIGEFLVFIGAFPVWPLVTGIAAFAIVLTAGYITWMLMKVFFGQLDEHKWHALTDADAREKFIVAALLGVIILTGMYPSSVADVIAVGVAPIAKIFS
jgi:NADH-quinone oxidoreductase subunit M